MAHVLNSSSRRPFTHVSTGDVVYTVSDAYYYFNNIAKRPPMDFDMENLAYERKKIKTQAAKNQAAEYQLAKRKRSDPTIGSEEWEDLLNNL